MPEREMITLTAEDGEKLSLLPLTETRLAGRSYLAAEETDPEDPGFEGEIYILRAAGDAGNGEYASYEIVEDENELMAVLVLLKDELEELGITVES